DFHVTGVQTCALPISPRDEDEPEDRIISGEGMSWTIRFWLESPEADERIDAESLWADAHTPGLLGRSIMNRRQKLTRELTRAREIGRATWRESVMPKV